MRSMKNVYERIKEEQERLKTEKGHMASITRGWIDALQWVLDDD